MKALEFKATIDNNQITVPDSIQSELKTSKDVRVIILFDDTDLYDENAVNYIAHEQFLKGYFDTDSIYDNY